MNSFYVPGTVLITLDLTVVSSHTALSSIIHSSIIYKKENAGLKGLQGPHWMYHMIL